MKIKLIITPALDELHLSDAQIKRFLRQTPEMVTDGEWVVERPVEEKSDEPA